MQKRTVYLDNAATTWPKPAAVARAMSSFLDEPLGNPGRGTGAPAQRAAGAMTRLRATLAGVIGATDHDRVTLSPGATWSISTAILACFSERMASGARTDKPVVVSTVLEHNAVRRPLAWLRDRDVIDVVEVTCDDEGFIDPDDVVNAVDERTAMVCMTHASNVLGTIQDVAPVGRAIRERFPDTLLLVDGSQAVGHVTPSVEEWGIDLYAISGHKGPMGPPGIGAMYVSQRAYDGLGSPLEPLVFGGTGTSLSETMPQRMPTRFEAGTQNVLGAVGLLAALEAEDRRSFDDALAHERRLIDRVRAHIDGNRRVRAIGPAGSERTTGVLTLAFADFDAADAGGVFDAQFSITVRAGLHCAPGVHRRLGTLDSGGAVRVSPGVWSTDEDIDALLAAIDRMTR